MLGWESVDLAEADGHPCYVASGAQRPYLTAAVLLRCRPSRNRQRNIRTHCITSKHWVAGRLHRAGVVLRIQQPQGEAPIAPRLFESGVSVLGLCFAGSTFLDMSIADVGIVPAAASLKCEALRGTIDAVPDGVYICVLLDSTDGTGAFACDALKAYMQLHGHFHPEVYSVNLTLPACWLWQDMHRLRSEIWSMHASVRPFLCAQTSMNMFCIAFGKLVWLSQQCQGYCLQG